MASGSDPLEHPEMDTLLPHEESLVGAIIDGRFEFEKFQRHDSHADVYTVRNIEKDRPSLEARAYLLDGIPEKLRKHRLRNINRLSNRTVLEFRYQILLVVIYTAGDGVIGDAASDESKPRPIDKKSPKKSLQSKHKNDHQFEMARIQQLERRKATRRKKRLIDAPANTGGEVTKWGIGKQQATDDEEAFICLLKLAQSNQQELRQKLPENARTALESYLKSEPSNFEDVEEMEAVMKIKQREASFLTRQLRRMPEIEKVRHDEYEYILREQIKFPKSSKEYKDMQENVVRARQRCMDLRNVKDILPPAISESENIYRTLRNRLPLIRKKKLEIESLQALSFEHESLKKMVAVAKKCSQAVLPASGAYESAVSLLDGAEKALSRFETKSTESLETMGSLQAEYHELLSRGAKLAL